MPPDFLVKGVGTMSPEDEAFYILLFVAVFLSFAISGLYALAS